MDIGFFRNLNGVACKIILQWSKIINGILFRRPGDIFSALFLDETTRNDGYYFGK